MPHHTFLLSPQRLFSLLSYSMPYYAQSWHEVDEECGMFGSTHPRHFNMDRVGTSSPVIEYVIRPHVNLLCVCAAYLCLSARHYLYGSVPRQRCEDMLRRGIEWACQTHVTGTRDVEAFCMRKRWGGNWQSGLWTSILTIAAFYARAYISDGLWKDVLRVLAWEADRFTGVFPPTGCEYDTKCEENAQDALVITWAAALMPSHAHIAAWKHSEALWATNIATTVFDKARHTRLHTSSRARMVHTCTLYPDMTAENHGFFSPSVLSYTAWVALAMSAYHCTAQSVPDYFHTTAHRDTFDTLLTFCLPNGLLYTPGGSDLPLFMASPLSYIWGLWHNDVRASAMTEKLLQWLEQYTAYEGTTTGQWVPGFSAVHEGWELLFQSDVGFGLSLLALLPFGEQLRHYSPGHVDASINTHTNFGFVELCYARNTQTSRSVAWKAIGDHPIVCINVHSSPELVVPHNAAGLGIPKTTPGITAWHVTFHNDAYRSDGFDTYGEIIYTGADAARLLQRHIRILTWGEDGIVVLDRIFACAEVSFHEQHLSGFFITNDEMTGNRIHIQSGSLTDVFDASTHTTRAVDCPSFWASLQQRFLFQFVWGRNKGLCYLPSGTRNCPAYWKNCRVDTLAIRSESRRAHPGECVYQAGYFAGAGKTPRGFKSSGNAGAFFKGLVIMDGKQTVGIA